MTPGVRDLGSAAWGRGSGFHSSYLPALELEEAFGLQVRRGTHLIDFDAKLHPRDRTGKFAAKLGQIKPGERAVLPGGTRVVRTTSGFEVQHPHAHGLVRVGHRKERVQGAHEAAQRAVQADLHNAGSKLGTASYERRLSERVAARGGSVKDEDAEIHAHTHGPDAHKHIATFLRHDLAVGQKGHVSHGVVVKRTGHDSYELDHRFGPGGHEKGHTADSAAKRAAEVIQSGSREKQKKGLDAAARSLVTTAERGSVAKEKVEKFDKMRGSAGQDTFDEIAPALAQQSPLGQVPGLPVEHPGASAGAHGVLGHGSQLTEPATHGFHQTLGTLTQHRTGAGHAVAAHGMSVAQHADLVHKIAKVIASVGHLPLLHAAIADPTGPEATALMEAYEPIDYAALGRDSFKALQERALPGKHPLPIDFDKYRHPRGRGGRFIDVPGGRVDLSKLAGRTVDYKSLGRQAYKEPHTRGPIRTHGVGKGVQGLSLKGSADAADVGLYPGQRVVIHQGGGTAAYSRPAPKPVTVTKVDANYVHYRTDSGLLRDFRAPIRDIYGVEIHPKEPETRGPFNGDVGTEAALDLRLKTGQLQSIANGGGSAHTRLGKVKHAANVTAHPLRDKIAEIAQGGGTPETRLGKVKRILNEPHTAGPRRPMDYLTGLKPGQYIQGSSLGYVSRTHGGGDVATAGEGEWEVGEEGFGWQRFKTPEEAIAHVNKDFSAFDWSVPPGDPVREPQTQGPEGSLNYIDDVAGDDWEGDGALVDALKNNDLNPFEIDGVADNVAASRPLPGHESEKTEALRYLRAKLDTAPSLYKEGASDEGERSAIRARIDAHLGGLKEPQTKGPFTPFLSSPGRGGSGGLRNFKAMSHDKLSGVIWDLKIYGKDPEALDAAVAAGEAKGISVPDPPGYGKQTVSDPPEAAPNVDDTFDALVKSIDVSKHVLPHSPAEGGPPTAPLGPAYDPGSPPEAPPKRDYTKLTLQTLKDFAAEGDPEAQAEMESRHANSAGTREIHDLGEVPHELIAKAGPYDDDGTASTGPLFGSFVGKRVVVTGKIEGYTRDEIEAMVEDHGGHVVPIDRAKAPDLVVAGEKAGSKLRKAVDRKIPVMAASEAMKLLVNSLENAEVTFAEWEDVDVLLEALEEEGEIE